MNEKSHAGRGTTSARLKKALKCKNEEVHKHFPKEVKKVKIKLMGLLPSTISPKRKSNILSVVAATAEHLCGENQVHVEKKYKLQKGEVNRALRMFFPSKEERLSALSNILLDNALIGAVIYQKKKSELSPMQAAISSGLFTDKYIQLQKAKTNNFAPDAPVSLILRLEETLAKAKIIHGKTIDI